LAVIFLIYSNATQVAAMTHEDPLSIDTKYNTVWLYNYIDRESQKPVLGLFFDPFDIQSAMFVDDPDKLVFAYTKFYRLAEYFEPGFKKALMIGGCAYSFPKYFLSNYKEALIDVVEIDQGLTEIAKKYFHLEPTDHLRVFHEDGRTYLNETAEKYDVIYGDAFNAASAVPFQLTTEESVGKMKDILNDNGVVIINLIGSLKGDGADFPRAEYATFKKVFGNQVYLFKVKNYSADNLQNLVLVALKGEDRLAERKTDFLDDELKIMLLDKKIDFQDLPEFYNSQLVLTDDFAPVEYYKYKSLR
jgi:spermidine synthase